MTVLLDTNAFVWAISNQAKLSPVAKQILASDEQKLLSPLTFYELAQKVRVGKLELPTSPSEFARLGAESLEAEWLAVDFAHVQHSDRLPWHHRDPFDRILALQALAEGIPVVSSDDVFDRYGLRRMW